jgi:hypothetical protein
MPECQGLVFEVARIRGLGFVVWGSGVWDLGGGVWG